MGRRKIEIKAIKDDRNRSVTFLKRKGGLFKKAHELSVLCSVEVAVIIFGTNKKLYEYSSHDIHDTIQKYQYYGGPHEHKGPADYMGKGGEDGSDGEDGDEAGEEQGQQQNQAQHIQQGPHQMPGQPLYPPPHPHMRPGQGPSASPPMGSNNMPYNPHRQRTPQPPMGMGSRPASRNDIIRRNTPGIPPQHTPPMNTPPMHGPHPPQNGYPHMPSQVYHQVNGQQLMYQPQQQQHPHTGGFAPQGFTQFPPHNPQMQQIYAQEQRRGSMPPQFQEPPRPQSHPQVQVQEPPPQQTMSPPQIQPEQSNEGLQPHQPKPVKHNSIFTPIDNSRSMLAASWGLGASPIDTPVKSEPEDRAKSAEATPLPMKPQPEPVVQSRPEPPFQPQRTQSTTSLSGDASKRPRLKVHIPSEPSEDGVSAGSAPASTQKGQGTESTTNSTPSKNKDGPAGSGVILPPPSPSASAILSAGATGPPNPFARPPPPQSSGGPSQTNAAAFANNQGASAFDAQTPMSALPSRFAGQLLPSPSQFFSDWGNFRSGEDSAILPSPLTFQTPVLPNGPGFGSGQGASNEGDVDEKKRKLEEDHDVGGEKRVKT